VLNYNNKTGKHGRIIVEPSEEKQAARSLIGRNLFFFNIVIMIFFPPSSCCRRKDRNMMSIAGMEVIPNLTFIKSCCYGNV